MDRTVDLIAARHQLLRLTERDHLMTLTRRFIGGLALAVLASAFGAGGAEAQDKVIRIGFQKYGNLILLKGKGWLEKKLNPLGYKVEWKEFPGGPQLLEALNVGAIDAGTTGETPPVFAQAAGAPLVYVGVEPAAPDGEAILVPKDSKITSVADLKGKKVAAEQGTVDHYLLLLALRKAGLTEKDVQFTPLLTDAAAAAFVAGKVDAVGVFAPFTTTALGLKGSKPIATSKDFPGAIPDHLVFGAGFVKDHPAEVQGMVQTWFDTTAWIKANPEKAIDIMAKRGGVSAADYKSYDAGTTIFSRQQNLDAFATGGTAANLDFQAAQIGDFLVSTGLAEEKPSLDGLLEPKFVQAVKE
jgi:NitT/TauT family transport system substrate-binding protein